jgi:hypothetical protein
MQQKQHYAQHQQLLRSAAAHLTELIPDIIGNLFLGLQGAAAAAAKQHQQGRSIDNS